MGMNFKIDGAREAKEMYRGAARRARNLQPKMRTLGEEFLGTNARRLAAGVDVDGKPFIPSRRAQKFGGRTMEDSGELGNSTHYATSRSALELYSTSKKARVHYEGLLIRPKNGKFLTIPLRASGGVFAGAALDMKKNRAGDRARHFKNTFFLRRGRNLFLMQKLGGKRLRALFMLVTSVQMKKRKWFGYSRSDVARAHEVMGGYITGDKP